MFLYMKVEGDLDKETLRKRPCDNGGRCQNDVLSCGSPRTADIHQMLEWQRGFLPQSPQKANPAHTGVPDLGSHTAGEQTPVVLSCLVCAHLSWQPWEPDTAGSPKVEPSWGILPLGGRMDCRKAA